MGRGGRATIEKEKKEVRTRGAPKRTSPLKAAPPAMAVHWRACGRRAETSQKSASARHAGQMRTARAMRACLPQCHALAARLAATRAPRSPQNISIFHPTQTLTVLQHFEQRQGRHVHLLRGVDLRRVRPRGGAAAAARLLEEALQAVHDGWGRECVCEFREGSKPFSFFC